MSPIKIRLLQNIRDIADNRARGVHQVAAFKIKNADRICAIRHRTVRINKIGSGPNGILRRNFT